MTKVVESRWEGGLRFTSTDEFGGVVAQEGADGESGYRPSALLLASLAGCTAMDVISILTKKRQGVQRYEVHTTGEQRQDHPQSYHAIVVEHELTGAHLDLDAVRRAILLSATRYCPVTAQLSQGEVTISHRYRVHLEEGDQTAEVVVTGPNGAGLDPVVPE
ncbi:MAG: OsmC family protein [Chloroflexi bacterium]|nr:OsmC family protein [Chloroflexota bacterium]